MVLCHVLRLNFATCERQKDSYYALYISMANQWLFERFDLSLKSGLVSFSLSLNVKENNNKPASACIPPLAFEFEFEFEFEKKVLVKKHVESNRCYTGCSVNGETFKISFFRRLFPKEQLFFFFFFDHPRFTRMCVKRKNFFLSRAIPK